MNANLQKLLDEHSTMVRDPKTFLELDSEDKRPYFNAILDVEQQLKIHDRMMSAINEFEKEFPEEYMDEVKDGHITLTMPVEIFEDLLDARLI